MSPPESAGGDRYAEDIIAGTTIALGEWTVSREEIIAFGTQWDPLPFHTDEALARQTPMGGLIASGLHTLGILQRLTVETVWSQFPFVIGRSMGDLRMLRPVRPGDTLTGSLRWQRVELRQRGRARAGYLGQLHNQSGELAFAITGEVVLPMRAEG